MSDIKAKLEHLKQEKVVVIGIPFDENSSFMKGSALGPEKIRQMLYSESTNLCAENGLDLGKEPSWLDIGDIGLSRHGIKAIEDHVEQILEKDLRVLSLGGDHSITCPIVRSYAKKYKKLSLLHIDAHPDLYHEFEGNSYSNACPFARIMEENLVSRLVSFGIRTMNPHQRDQAERFGVEVIEMKNWTFDMTFEFDGPLYISLDLDGLDPAFAPGVSHPEPGGLSTREVLRTIQNVKGNVVGADIVEYNPKRDLNGITGMVAAKFYKEFVVRLLDF